MKWSIYKKLEVVPCLFSLILAIACGGGGGGSGGDTSVENKESSQGTLKVTVIDSTGQAIAGAHIIVFNGNSSEPIGGALNSNNDGVAAANYESGFVTMKISAQGYNPSPRPGESSVPLLITSSNTTATTITLSRASNAGSTGWVVGFVRQPNGSAVSGALVTGQVGDITLTATTD